MSMHKFRKQSLPPELENISQDELEEFREAFRLFDKVTKFKTQFVNSIEFLFFA